MRAGVVLKSVLPYLWLYRLYALVILPRKSHRESRRLFINEAKKLYQKEFKKWFSLTAGINPLLKLFRMKDTGIPTLYVMGDQDHMFLPSVKQSVEYCPSAALTVIPDCGHVVNIESPAIFNRVSIEFLNGLSVAS